MKRATGVYAMAERRLLLYAVCLGLWLQLSPAATAEVPALWRGRKLNQLAGGPVSSITGAGTVTVVDVLQLYNASSEGGFILVSPMDRFL